MKPRPYSSPKSDNMKKVIFSALPIVAISVMTWSSINDPLPIGAALPNPEVKMKDVSGKEISLKESIKRNGLLVMFSCNTCPVVGKYQSRTIELGKYAASKDVGVILLNANEATRDDGESFSEMQAYAKEQGYNFNYVIDEQSRMADAFGASRTPEVYLFDKNAKLVYHGAVDDNVNGPDQVTRKHAQVAIDELAAGKEVSMKQTRSVGCTIKRVE